MEPPPRKGYPEALMDDLLEPLRQAGQDHLIDALLRLDAPARDGLAGQIRALDLGALDRMIHDLVLADEAPDVPLDIEPPDVVGLARGDGDRARDRHARLVGEEVLAEGRVAAVLVAGGQGTRLGFEGPKGAYPFGPVTGCTLFAHHAAKIAAVRDRYRCELPWYVMTSQQNDAATREVFDRADWFGLPHDSVRLFTQGTLPAVDRRTGRILLDAPDRLALSPDGHGGVFNALRRQGLLDEMRERGITTLFTFQVDNPLVRVARPELLGHHTIGGSEMTNVVVRKRHPAERMGIVARCRNRTILVEYSDLPDHLAEARDAAGDLVFWAGSIAVHCIQLELAERVTEDGAGLPYHRAIKRVPHVDAEGRPVTPDEPNAVKFESFIFDALPRAERVMSVEAAREDEFSPIKNADGDDSPATARDDLNRLYARWLADCGVAVPCDGEGAPVVDIEIDPRYALDPAELADRIPADLRVDGPLALGSGGRTAPE
jgi:UDP-N-acetylglucosamine/UDP-N-acetylgalactosamine diphosphorylase